MRIQSFLLLFFSTGPDSCFMEFMWSYSVLGRIDKFFFFIEIDQEILVVILLSWSEENCTK